VQTHNLVDVSEDANRNHFGNTRDFLSC